MIERYTLEPLGAYWSKAYQYQTWREVEIHSAIAKGAPDSVVHVLANTPIPHLDAIAAEEMLVKHDVVAFLNTWRERLPAEAAGWVHKGMTSSDLVDTANSVRLVAISDELFEQLTKLELTLAQHALAHWTTPRVARTHGQNAQGSTWGYRVADFTMALGRVTGLLRAARADACVAKISGPVGDYRDSSISEEAEFGRKLGLEAAFCSTQVVSRDRLATFMFALSQVASVIEAMALEVRLSAHSQVGELIEGFTELQQGSSAMPHKQNPIVSEQLCGLAKLVRAQVVPVQEGVALWHERDISHSSVERIAVQTATTITHYMIVKAIELFANLIVCKEVMLANLDSAQDATLSARIKDLLIEYGWHPTPAWLLVREAASIPHPDLIGKVNMLLEQKGSPDRVPYFHDQPRPNTDHVLQRMQAVIRRNRGVTMTFYPDTSDPTNRITLNEFVRDIRVYDDYESFVTDNASPDAND